MASYKLSYVSFDLLSVIGEKMKPQMCPNSGAAEDQEVLGGDGGRLGPLRQVLQRPQRLDLPPSLRGAVLKRGLGGESRRGGREGQG